MPEAKIFRATNLLIFPYFGCPNSKKSNSKIMLPHLPEKWKRLHFWGNHWSKRPKNHSASGNPRDISMSSFDPEIQDSTSKSEGDFLGSSHLDPKWETLRQRIEGVGVAEKTPWEQCVSFWYVWGEEGYGTRNSKAHLKLAEIFGQHFWNFAKQLWIENAKTADQRNSVALLSDVACHGPSGWWKTR